MLLADAYIEGAVRHLSIMTLQGRPAGMAGVIPMIFGLFSANSISVSPNTSGILGLGVSNRFL